MRQNTVGCIPSLAGLRPISMEESSVSNLVLSTGSNHYVIHVPAHSYAHPIHVTRTCNKPSFQTILLQGIFGYQFEGSVEHRKLSSSYQQERNSLSFSTRKEANKQTSKGLSASARCAAGVFLLM